MYLQVKAEIQNFNFETILFELDRSSFYFMSPPGMITDIIFISNHPLLSPGRGQIPRQFVNQNSEEMVFE